MSEEVGGKTWNVGDQCHGFRVQQVKSLEDLRCQALLLEHEQSGARLLHLHADDPENLMALGFRTPPQDDTGLPHILEHTVLCGSRRYPVKDPFVEMLKTSLATFLNAMTYPDKTVYPCASMNEKDFYHLAGVYCDAVFHPLITEAHFKQEGHHREFADISDPESPLIVKGIVYNEMKGGYSTLDGTLGREGRRLFPDNAYGLDSGGDPEHIPELSYEDFTAFHRRYYHPSNAFIFIYGDLPTAQHLAFLDREYLSGFDRIDVDTSIANQPRWSEARQVTVPYPASPDETPETKSAVLIEYLANPVTDASTALAMDILADYLLGNSASPLRKALIDSELGEDLTWAGYSAYRRDTSFMVGLKGIDQAQAGEVVDLVQATCRRIAEEGLDPGKLEASLHQFDLDARAVPDQYPLHLMDRAYNSWIYDADPLILLEPSKHMAAVREQYAHEPGFFEGLLRTYIVDNPHRLALTAVPDAQLSQRRDTAFAEKMAEVKTGLSDAEKQVLVTEAEALVTMQNAPNRPDDLATLPRLQLGDVSPETIDFSIETGEAGGIPLLQPDVFANRLTHFQLAFDLRGLDDALLDDVPLFCDAVSRMGAAGLDYAAMAEREARVSGGVSLSSSISTRVDNTAFVRPILLAGTYGLEEHAEAFLEVLRLRLMETDFSDRQRLKDLLKQGAVRRRNAIIPRGNLYAARYAQRGLSHNAALMERMEGLQQARRYRRYADHAEDELDGILERFAAIQAQLLQRGRVRAACTGGEASQARVTEWLGALSAALADGNPAETPPPTRPDIPVSERIGMAMAADVAFVARAQPAVPFTHPHAPALNLVGSQLSYGYLWNEVRVKGGAYGCGARYDAALGTFTFSSYRDPTIGRTLGVYDRVFDHVRQDMPLDEDSVGQYVIGTLKSLDRPIRPAGTPHQALLRDLAGATPEVRQAYRDRLLSLRSGDIRAAVEEVVEPGFAASPMCVISSRERLEQANDETDGSGLVVEDL